MPPRARRRIAVADYYGEGERCDEDEDCALAQIDRVTADVPALLGVIRGGVGELLMAGADPERLVAIGYCLGARVVLELARHPRVGASEGVAFRAVSSVHGIYQPLGAPAARGAISAAVQVHHADLDFQGDAGLASLESELKAGVDGSSGEWESIKYAKAAHSFTEPRLAVYRARAALQAHRSSFDFFRMAVGDLDPTTEPYYAGCGLVA
jgi:dienelactone hydrolase